MILPASIVCQFQFPPRKNWHFPLHRAGIGNAKQLHWHSRRGFKTVVDGEKGSLKKHVFLEFGFGSVIPTMEFQE